MEKNFLNQKQKGAAMMVVMIFFLAISILIISGLVPLSLRDIGSVTESLNSKKSYFLAESGIEDAMYRIITNKKIGSSETITLDSNSVITNIDNVGGNEKEIISFGDISNYERTINLSLVAGTGVSFGYGVQTGIGGLIMGNNSVIEGSVYSNGTITGGGEITGTALSANTSALSADQTNNSGAPSYDVTFCNASSTQDFAQSFKVSKTEVVSKVDLYLKKNSSSTPSNITIRIVSDSSGSPGNTTLTSGSLFASSVSTSYGWVEVPFSSHPELIEDTTYWIVMDCSYSTSKYYIIGANNNEYENGTGKIGIYGGSWNNTSPSGLDGFFKLYIGGLMGLIDGIEIGEGGVGNAYSHTVNNSSIAGTNYCQTGSGNNKSCNTSLSDPVQVPMPISEQNILDWKAEAQTGGIYSGNYSLNDNSNSLGPKEITGNLYIANGADFTVTGTLWVKGNMTVENGAKVRLSASYGTSEGVIVVDGIVNIENNAIFYGSGSAGSYLMVLSTSTSTSAITLSNNGGAVILYAANGTVNLANNARAKSLNGKWINLANGARVVYDSGLANANFVNGPTGGWEIVDWKEIE